MYIPIWMLDTSKEVYGYDFDGVISIGITPRSSEDVIITGRCIDEADYVRATLLARGITNKVYFNPMTLRERGNHTKQARRYSGSHKAKTISELKKEGIYVTRFFEDDELQALIIKNAHSDIELVYIDSNLVEK